MLKLIKAQLKDRYSKEVLKSALDKTRRFMKAAYGRVDWMELEAEGSALETVIAYCEDTLKHPDGQKTFNKNHFGRSKS